MNPSLAAKVMEWSRPTLGLFVLIIFAIAFYEASINKDATTLSLLVGAIIAMVNQVIGYFFGSSASSQKKDDALAAAAATPTAVTVAAPPA